MTDTVFPTPKKPLTDVYYGTDAVTIKAQYNGHEISSTVEGSSPREGFRKALSLMDFGDPVEVVFRNPVTRRNGETSARVLLNCGTSTFPGYAINSDPELAEVEAATNAMLAMMNVRAPRAVHCVL